jgi:taurine dioxygenase
VSNINFRPLHPMIGAEVSDLDLSRPIPPEMAQELVDLWEEHSVLLFRKQNLTPDDQLRVTGYFGEVREVFFKSLEARKNATDTHPAIAVISNVTVDGKPVGAAGDGELWFHSDHCYLERSGHASVLYGIEVTTEGGDTRFGSGYGAYEALSPEMKAKLRGVMADFIYDRELNELARTMPPRLGHSQCAVHPVVVEHPGTGRPSLFVNRLMTARLQGMDEAESDSILDHLFDFQESPRFVYDHKWQPGDLLVWDNRSCIHSRTHFDPNLRRVMRRTATMGSTLGPYLG